MKWYQDMKSCPEATKDSTVQEKDTSPPQLDSSKEQLENLSKRYEELEAKSKADIKVLVKEVKSLRSSQTELKHELSKSLKEKSEAEVICCSLNIYNPFHLVSFSILGHLFEILNWFFFLLFSCCFCTRAFLSFFILFLVILL